ncbi:MAG: family 20 glycosylhydrolase [Candidatus Eremiobacteraeota bacterium]|nr:family 20 glycosylhydrolase [Candidatus Eremiobacteraeota bacterium]
MAAATRAVAALLIIGITACANSSRLGGSADPVSLTQHKHSSLASTPSVVPQPQTLRTYRGSAVVSPVRYVRSVMPPSAYTLAVGSHGATIRASSRAGFAYGLTTLRQIASAPPLTAVQVVDRPAFRWRGLHLDVSRHFFAPAVIRRYIDLAARYKLNIFHWHLTDDQAWRLQIERYPRLTLACSVPPCGFYTQRDVRAIVQYAQSRNVTIVPEIEMPAHASAAIRAYPELACGRRDALCPREATIGFLENVLAEVAALFPSPYIHIGGDEAPPAVNRYVLPRIEAVLRSRGRRAVVWDDALESGISHAAIVAAWNGDRRAIVALDSGYDVVMVPDGPLYFNAYQGAAFQEPPAAPHLATLEQVYSYDPTPDGLNARESSHIVGVEAAVWTEKIASPERLFETVLPRTLALSEIAWTTPSRKSWGGFLTRLPAQLAWLQANGYRFRLPAPIIRVSGSRLRFHSIARNAAGALALTDSNSVIVAIDEPMRSVSLRYTLDGSVPTAKSNLYTAPLPLSLDRSTTRTLTAAAFENNGRKSEASEVIVKRIAPSELNREIGSRSWASLVSP